MRFAHVIFDCDGVLVDTESIAQKVVQKIFRHYDVELSLHELDALFTGKSAAYAGEWLIANSKQKLTLQEFEAIHDADMYAAFQQGVEPIAHVREALELIQTPKSVATNGIRKRATYSLTSTGLLPFFEGRLNTVEDVANPKPAPDLYLLTAERAGVKPETCVVIEDSQSGVTAATAAGMNVLGFVGLAHDQRSAAEGLRKCGARAILSDMRALHTALDWL